MQGRVRAFAASLSIAALLLGTMPPIAAEAAGPGSLEGKVIAGAGGPVQGAVVLVRGVEDAREHASAPTGEDGAYRLSGLPTGEYDVAVRTEKGIYLGARSLVVTAVTDQSYSFRIEDRPGLDAAALAALAQAEQGEEQGGEQGEKPPKRAKQGGQPRLGWNNPLVVLAAGLAFVVTTGALIDAASDDEDDDGSPGGS